MQKERNIGEILIVKDVAATGAMEGTNVDNHLSSMTVGEAVVVNPAGIVLDAATATTLTEKFKIGTKLTSGKIQWTDLIDAKSIESIQANSYVATTLQVDYIGSDGTDGEIDLINNNNYYVRLNIQPLDLAGFMQQSIKFGVFRSGTATQYAVATGIANSLIANLSREPEKIKSGLDVIKVERVTSGTLTAVPTSADNFTFTKGSKYFTATDIDDDAGAAALAVGDLLVIGTAATSPVYKIATIDTATDTGSFDIAYQGTSGVIADTGLKVVTVANQAAANWGVKLSAVAHTFDVPKFNLCLPRWTAQLEDFGDTTVVTATETVEGVGDWRMIAMLEQQFQGNEGNYYRAQVPSPTYRSEVATDGEYAVIVIEHEDVMTGNLGNTEKSLKQTYIACVKGDGTTYTDDNTGLGDTLDAIATKYGFTATANIATVIENP